MNENYSRLPFIGVVEDRMDPLKLQRVRVRCFFYHSADKTLIPTKDLPWATVTNNLRLKEGDHVRGYFEDGSDKQTLTVTEWIAGIPETQNEPTKGFNDPRTQDQLKDAPRAPKELKYPDDGSGVKIVEQEAAPAGLRLDEPCLNRLVRGEFLDDYKKGLQADAESLSNYPLGLESALTGVVNSILISAQQKITGLIAGLLNKIPGASLFIPTIIRDFFTQPYFKKYTLSSTYTFPPSPAAPKYPYNNAVVSESGHIQECDDTPGAERIHTRHRSGTYEEYYPDGDHVRWVRKDKHQIVDGADHTIVKGSRQTVVEGSESVTVRGAKYVQIEGSCQIVVIGNADLSVQGNATRYIKGDLEEVIGGNFKQTIVGTAEYVYQDESKFTYLTDTQQYYEKDWIQFMKTGEWTLKTNKKAFRWFFRSSPLVNRNINTGIVILPDREPVEGNPDVFSSREEFELEPTVQIKAIDKLTGAGDLTNFDVANAGFTIIETANSNGFSIV